MPALLIYLFKVNIALILFCACYYLIFRKLTFYTLNRVYLITALLFSSVYPLIDFSNILPQHEVVKPLQITNVQLIYSVSNYGKTVASQGLENWWQYLLIIFWAGVTLMAIRLVLQFASLFNIYRRSIPQKIHNHPVRIIKNEASAFSFWQSIYINPDKYSESEVKSVVAHEQVHVRQWHTLDILLAEISLVFYWFNPGIWLIKKAISENLEFITDREILKQGVNAKNYQYSLLYASFNTSPNAVVNHFNISTIKKRIMMMNSKKSSVFSLGRYGLMIPVVTALLLVFGTSKAELIKKSINQADEISHKALNAAKKIVLSTNDNVEEKNKPNDKLNKRRPVGTLLETAAGTEPIIGATKISTDTPKVKAFLKNALKSGPSADSVYYLLNGKPINYEQMQKIDPYSIESVSVLKGAAATSLFGDIAWKGAVLIITKGQANSTDVQRIMQRIPAANTVEKTSSIQGNHPNNATGSVSSYEKNDSTAATSDNVGQRPVIAIGSKIKDREITVRGFASPQKKVTVGPNGSLREVITHGYPIHNTAIQKSKLASPLFIINGKPASKQDFDKLDPNKIEKLEIAKDSSAKAIWGAIAKDGVIMITTREGIKGKAQN
jgi:bla regulator protein BlaR1